MLADTKIPSRQLSSQLITHRKKLNDYTVFADGHLTAKVMEKARKTVASSTEYHIGYYAVCAIDILGQQERLAEWSRLPSSDDLSKVLPAIKKTAGTVKVLKNEFEDFFNALNIPGASPDLMQQLTQEQKDLYFRARTYSLGTQQFGDTFVFYSPLSTSNGDETTFPLHGMVQACCLFMTYCLGRGVPLRGGICIGSGIELEPGLFYGPAMALAHDLESKVAEYPRIVVAPEVVQYIERRSGYSEDGTIDLIMSNIAKSSRNCMQVDDDGCMVLDYLGTEFHKYAECFTVQIPHSTFVAEAYRFAITQREQFRNGGNRKLAFRYHRLVTYLESRLHLWPMR